MAMMELFQVAAKLVLDKSGYEQDVQEADKSGKSLAENLSGYMEKAKNVITGIMGAIAIKKVASDIWDLAKETAAAGDRIDKTSQALGLSRQAFQEWDYILAQNGASIDSLGASMRTLQSAISANSGETAAALSQLGLSAAHLQSISPEEQFEAVVKALQKLPDGAKKSQLAMQLLGRNAQSLMPLLNSSAEATEELRQRAHDLGLVMSDEDIDASVAFGDALDDLNKTWTGFKQKIGAQILPFLTTGLKTAADSLGKVSNAVKDAFKNGDWQQVFRTVVDELKKIFHIDQIKWPTWAEVKAAASTAWEGIKKGLATLVNTIGAWVFGERDDGAVDWPTWSEVADMARSAINGIISGLGSLVNELGKFIFGERDDGSIDWPTWDEIGQFAVAAWNGIVKGLEGLVTELGKFVFGERDDGSVDWPTWGDVEQAAKDAINGIITGITSLTDELGAFIFGKRDDGSVKWPTWAEVGQAARDAVSSIITGLGNLITELGSFIFGKQDKSAATEWPTWPDIEAVVKSAWEGIQKGLEGLGDLLGAFVFGTRDDGAINWPTWDSIQQSAYDAWDGIVKGLEGFVTSIGSFVFGSLNKDALKWPTWADVSKAAEDAWRGIKEGLANLVVTVGKFVFGEKDQDSLNWIETVKGWFDSSGKSVIINLIDGTIGEWLNRVRNWLQGVGNSAKINLKNGDVGTWFITVKDWIEAKTTEATINFAETVTDWYKRIKNWVDGGTKVVVNFWSGTVGQWLQTVLNWVRNGIKIGVEFFNKGVESLTNETGAFQGGEASGPQWGEPSVTDPVFVPGWNAKGLNYVPYDGYALVHRGETILNQDKSRSYRENNSFSPQDLYNAVAAAVESAISNIQINLDGKQVGNAVTNQVSKNIYKAQYGRRFTYA